jgi:hypothetical protein
MHVQELLNLNRVMLGGRIVAIVLFLTLRSIMGGRTLRLAALAAHPRRSPRGWRGRLRQAHR